MIRQNPFLLKHGPAVVALVYVVLFVVISVFVFYEDDESRKISEIFHWNYLIPATIYSVFALWISLGLFLFMKEMFNSIFSFIASILIGIPAGLILLDKILQQLLK